MDLTQKKESNICQCCNFKRNNILSCIQKPTKSRKSRKSINPKDSTTPTNPTNPTNINDMNSFLNKQIEALEDELRELLDDIQMCNCKK